MLLTIDIMHHMKLEKLFVDSSCMLNEYHGIQSSDIKGSTTLMVYTILTKTGRSLQDSDITQKIISMAFGQCCSH